ncbi:hypothetical protein AYR66_07080 [Noviherbaspirillum denitrificans]|uniref:Uncharacterized protein n=1 Tax=Noviherbaspirillum denitrificans TaxID=1968433 RepID=A0A254THY4_9BURK|nr:hypothetical protein AYR66_07080 [Noviherbaspirillum denitrificans]
MERTAGGTRSKHELPSWRMPDFHLTRAQTHIPAASRGEEYFPYRHLGRQAKDIGHHSATWTDCLSFLFSKGGDFLFRGGRTQTKFALNRRNVSTAAKPH